LLFQGVGLAASRKWSRARNGFRAARSVHQDCAGGNRAGHQRASAAFAVCVGRSGRCSLYPTIRRETKRRRARFLTLVFATGKIQWEERPMAIVRNIEVIAQSPNGFDDACREAIREASKTLRGISSFWIKNAEVVVENDQITMFRVNGKISFLVEDR
jgi:flavin-binding protein dodecin